MTTRRRTLWLVVAVAAAAVVLGIATTALLATTVTYRGSAPPGWPTPAARYAVPALPGRTVDVTADDMGPGMMGFAHGRYPWYPTGMMRLTAHPATVPAGTISLRVRNVGALTHEVLVLPLPTGQFVGERLVGPDGRISETGSVGEASRSCHAGSGHGITAGATGWATLTLHPGRYELLCNLPGHYAAGMYAELDVTGR
ncbi:sulfocyanin-like copper-binding protein [Streptomyces sp. CG1]|uniref:sulfocyanin-like copper-binding protein n=1 Tax=Streptomyces sp. CG1 TaxID=1287523 RepID=UPI0034E1D98B